MPSPAKRFRYYLEYLCLASAYRVIPKFPRWFLRAFASVLGTVGYFFNGEGRRTATVNLEAAFPGKYSDAEIEILVRKCYRSWAQTYLDQFWTSRLTSETFQEHVTYQVDDPEGFARVRDGIGILMTPHYGNFEWGAACLGFHGIHYTAIAQDFKNPRLTEIFKKNRELLGHSLVPQKSAMLRLLRVLKKKGHAAFLPDLTVPPSQAATIIEVFGLKVSVTLLASFLIKKTGAEVLTGIAFPTSYGCHGHVLPIMKFSEEASEREIAQACWDAVEPLIAQRPENWLWMYKHFRFRPKTDGERYPLYANRSKKFDKLEKAVFPEETGQNRGISP